MKFIELFAGIGGFRYGLEKANIHTEGYKPDNRCQSIQGVKQSTKGFRCVWANEWDKYACQISRKNYPDDTLVEGDIRAVDPTIIPEHDLICAGFPCQSFSIAGKRGGFEDTRGTLFFEICRIAGAKRTPYLLLENVKGLLSHDEGRTFQTIIRTLDELGYDVQWQVLNSKDYGVPQNRERVFIIGHLRGYPRPKVFPIGEELCEANQEGYERGVSGTLSVKNQSGQAQWDGSTTLIVPTVRAEHHNTADVHFIVHENKSGARTPHPEAQALRSGASHNYQTVVPVQLGQGKKSWAMKHGTSIGSQEEAYVVRSDNPNAVMENNRIRRLTPTECERLQGFPDNWTEGISDTQRYKCLGNAVTTNVIEAIGKQWGMNEYP